MNPAEGREKKTEDRRRKSDGRMRLGFTAFSLFFNSKFLILNSKLGFKAFTLIELIIVIILASILVVSVVVKVIMTRSQTANIAAVDQAVAYIQYAQMRAMANRGANPNARLSITFSGGTDVYLCNSTACSSLCSVTPCNSGSAIETLKLPDNASVGTQTFSFNTLGEMNIAGNPTVSVGGKTITVYTVTGKVSVP